MRLIGRVTFGCLALASIGAWAGEPIIELQTEAITPALVFEEIRGPIYQVRLLVEPDAKRGTLIFDPNLPEFDEFGHLVGGVQTPQSRGGRGDLPLVQRVCALEFVKEGDDRWRLFRLTSEAITTPLWIATRGPILDGGPARLLVLGGDGKVQSVIAMTRYGLAIP